MRMTYTPLGLTSITVALIVGVTGCGTSSAPAKGTTATAPGASSIQPSPGSGGQSGCTALGGSLDTEGACRLHIVNPTYQIDFRYPVDYFDQQSVTDFLTQRRNDFVDWVGRHPLKGRPVPYLFNVSGKGYRSGTPPAGTQSLVLRIGDDTGVHPVTTFRAFNYDLAKRTTITFDTLFKPGTDPVSVLNPLVQSALAKPGAPGPQKLDLDATAYQNFAITDAAVTFFFNQDGPLPYEGSRLEVVVPRGKLESILA